MIYYYHLNRFLIHVYIIHNYIFIYIRRHEQLYCKYTRIGPKDVILLLSNQKHNDCLQKYE